MRNTEYMEFDHKVDLFLRKQMTASEQEEFQKFLLQNPSLLERAQTIAMTIKAMESVKAKREDRLLRAIQEMDEKEFRTIAKLPPLRQAPKMHKIARYAAAAAVVGMLCFGGTKYYKYERTINLGQTQYMAYVQELEQDIPRDIKIRYDYASQKGPKELCSIVNGVNDTILRGAEYPSEESIKVMRTLYPMFLKVRDGAQLQETIGVLSAIYLTAQEEDSPYNEYVDDIAWNLAIAYLKIGECDTPLPILQDIVERNPGYLHRSQPARNLIEQIQTIK